MCRFKSASLPILELPNLFQYIVCVGSRPFLYVKKLICAISIHRMCRFKFARLFRARPPCKFQYIVCVGSRISISSFEFSLNLISIHRMCRFKKIAYKLNSYTTVDNFYIIKTINELTALTYKNMDLLKSFREEIKKNKIK